MSETATTTLSSKGQVVIPEEIRNRLGLKAGTQFVVLGDGDVVIFKTLEAPSRDEFAARSRSSVGRQALRNEAARRVEGSGQGSPLQVRVILDTNVLVSGIFFGGGPGRIVDAWTDHRLSLILTPDILEEYARVGPKWRRDIQTVASHSRRFLKY